MTPLPCPFCGLSEGLEFHDGSTYRWGVASCVTCGATAGETRREYPDKGLWHQAAIEQWNTRAPDVLKNSTNLDTSVKRVQIIHESMHEAIQPDIEGHPV